MIRAAALLAALLLGTGCDRGTRPARVVVPPAASPETDMVFVPGGPFILGSDEVDSEGRAREFGSRRPWYEDEHPRQTMDLPPFRIDRTEVTEAAYRTFVREVGYPPPSHWRGDPPEPEHPEWPVVNVNWMDAQNYCHWRGARLPSEFEWEKAARGSDGRAYPWGGEFDPDRANTGHLGEIVAAGHFTESASPYGALDMAGNVWEWTSSWYRPYPGNDTPSEFYGRRFKVLRGGGGGAGGHYQLERLTTRSSYRFFLDPRAKVEDAGFRCMQALDTHGAPVDDRDATLHG